MRDYLDKCINESCDVKAASYRANKEKIESAIQLIFGSLSTGKKLLIFGNGGSAADSQHIATEFVVRLKKDRRAYPAIALTTDTSTLTACGNDYGFERIFERQVEALGNEGDAAIAISTSGSSPNVLRGIKEARNKKMKVIGFTGGGGGKMKKACDVLIDVRSKNSMRIQETHITFLHAICDVVEKMLAGR